MSPSLAEEKRTKFCSDNMCPSCVGTGFAIDQKRAGLVLVGLRQKAGLTMLEVSNRMGMTVAHLSNMEKGRRSWTSEQIEKYVTICTPDQTD